MNESVGTVKDEIVIEIRKRAEFRYPAEKYIGQVLTYFCGFREGMTGGEDEVV